MYIYSVIDQAYIEQTIIPISMALLHYFEYINI